MDACKSTSWTLYADHMIHQTDYMVVVTAINRPTNALTHDFHRSQLLSPQLVLAVTEEMVGKGSRGESWDDSHKSSS